MIKRLFGNRRSFISRLSWYFYCINVWEIWESIGQFSFWRRFILNSLIDDNLLSINFWLVINFYKVDTCLRFYKFKQILLFLSINFFDEIFFILTFEKHISWLAKIWFSFLQYGSQIENLTINGFHKLFFRIEILFSHQ